MIKGKHLSKVRRLQPYVYHRKNDVLRAVCLGYLDKSKATVLLEEIEKRGVLKR